jgi:hypothetical protein
MDITVGGGIEAEITLPAGDYAGVQVGIRASFETASGYTTLSTAPPGWHYPTGNPICTQVFTQYHNPTTLQLWAANDGCWYEDPVSGDWLEGLPSGMTSPVPSTLKVRAGSSAGPIISTLDADLDLTDSIDASYFFHNGVEWKTFPAPPDTLVI